MNRFRRFLTLLLLATFAGGQSVATHCIMDAGGERAVTAASHGDHASHPSGVAAHTSDDESEGVPEGHGAHPLDCDLMLACSAVAASSVTASVAWVPLTGDVAGSALPVAYASPTASFDPPPPRQNPI